MVDKVNGVGEMLHDGCCAWYGHRFPGWKGCIDGRIGWTATDEIDMYEYVIADRLSLGDVGWWW